MTVFSTCPRNISNKVFLLSISHLLHIYLKPSDKETQLVNRQVALCYWSFKDLKSTHNIKKRNQTHNERISH